MEHSYWENNGQYEGQSSILQDLIPAQGECPEPRKNRHLERFRIASNCYYDLHNNGLMNRCGDFTRCFKKWGLQGKAYRASADNMVFKGAIFIELEAAMDDIITLAFAEQYGKGNIKEGELEEAQRANG